MEREVKVKRLRKRRWLVRNGTGLHQGGSTRDPGSQKYHTIILVCCCMGFVYQTWSFIAIYLKYETVMDVQIGEYRSISFPAITFCQTNGMKRRPYCRINPEACKTVPAQKYLILYPNSKRARMGGSILVHNPNISEIFNEPQENLVQYFYYSNENFPNATMTEIDEKEEVHGRYFLTLTPSVRSSLKIPPACFAYNVIENNTMLMKEIPNNHELVVTRLALFDTTGIIGEEYPAGQISVHSPYNYINPYWTGKEIRPGVDYLFSIKLIVRKTLPSPYETNCFDYLKKRKEEGNPGPLNKKECIEECKMNMSLKELDCVLLNIWYPHNYRRCEPKTQAHLLFVYQHECSQKCSEACHEIEFEMTGYERSLTNEKVDCQNASLITALSFSDHMPRVHISFQPSVKIVYEVIPKYKMIEAIGKVGDFLGMWLGISLVAFFNSVEMFVKTVAFCVKATIKRRTEKLKKSPTCIHVV